MENWKIPNHVVMVADLFIFIFNNYFITLALFKLFLSNTNFKSKIIIIYYHVRGSKGPISWQLFNNIISILSVIFLYKYSCLST